MWLGMLKENDMVVYFRVESLAGRRFALISQSVSLSLAAVAIDL
jgi:hypothetical protein